jgi:hypothetical protein
MVLLQIAVVVVCVREERFDFLFEERIAGTRPFDKSRSLKCIVVSDGTFEDRFNLLPSFWSHASGNAGKSGKKSQKDRAR